MIVTAWKNDRHKPAGTSYGLKVKIPDRDKFFRKAWDHIVLELEGASIPIRVNIDNDSFWSSTCHELIHEEIRQWLWANNLAPWKKGHPPKMIMEQTAEGRFSLRKTTADSREISGYDHNRRL